MSEVVVKLTIVISALLAALAAGASRAADYPAPVVWELRGGLKMNGGPRIDLGSPEKLKFRTNFTLAARVKLNDDTPFGLVVGAVEAGGLVVSASDIKLATWGFDWVVEHDIPPGQWVHIAVTMSQDGANMGTIYINGKLIARGEIHQWPKNADRWTIGGWDVGEGFHGELGDVMVWNQALSAEEVKSVASSFGLDSPPAYPADDPRPISETPESVREMASQLKDLALEPRHLSRYPFHAMMGYRRADIALRTRTHKQREEIEKWLAEQIPTFDCPDPVWKRCYYYRWFVTRVNYMAENGVPGFLEGRRGGYGRHITYSAPHIMDEVRWLKDGSYAFGQAEILGKRREPDGRRFGGYTHWIPATLWGAYLVHPDKAALAKLLPAWQEDTECAFPGKLDSTRPDSDYLLAPPSHWSTGMEWQPAWFYFDNYDRTKETRLWRPDYTTYYYANARAVANGLRELGDKTEAAKFDKLAERIRGAVENMMWDVKTGYYYSVKVGGTEKPWVKEVVGIYPFTFGLPAKSRSVAFESIADPAEFWGPWPVTTCTMKCPMYTPKVQLCNWNGPVWPHAQSLVAHALANGIRVYKSPDVTPAKLYALLDSYTKLHYEDKGTWQQPNIHEEGNADDGAMYGCPDYFHSTYTDLIITLVGGLVPRDDDSVELYPVAAVPWDHFRLDRIPYRNHTLSIVWDSREDGKRYKGAPRGYSLYVDGKLIGTRPRMERVVFAGAVR